MFFCVTCQSIVLYLFYTSTILFYAFCFFLLNLAPFFQSFTTNKLQYCLLNISKSFQNSVSLSLCVAIMRLTRLAVLVLFVQEVSTRARKKDLALMSGKEQLEHWAKKDLWISDCKRQHKPGTWSSFPIATSEQVEESTRSQQESKDLDVRPEFSSNKSERMKEKLTVSLSFPKAISSTSSTNEKMASEVSEFGWQSSQNMERSEEVTSKVQTSIQGTENGKRSEKERSSTRKRLEIVQAVEEKQIEKGRIQTRQSPVVTSESSHRQEATPGNKNSNLSEHSGNKEDEDPKTIKEVFFKKVGNKDVGKQDDTKNDEEGSSKHVGLANWVVALIVVASLVGIGTFLAGIVAVAIYRRKRERRVQQLYNVERAMSPKEEYETKVSKTDQNDVGGGEAGSSTCELSGDPTVLQSQDKQAERKEANNERKVKLATLDEDSESVVKQNEEIVQLENEEPVQSESEDAECADLRSSPPLTLPPFSLSLVLDNEVAITDKSQLTDEAEIAPMNRFRAAETKVTFEQENDLTSGASRIFPDLSLSTIQHRSSESLQ